MSSNFSLCPAQFPVSNPTFFSNPTFVSYNIILSTRFLQGIINLLGPQDASTISKNASACRQRSLTACVSCLPAGDVATSRLMRLLATACRSAFNVVYSDTRLTREPSQCLMQKPLPTPTQSVKGQHSEYTEQAAYHPSQEIVQQVYREMTPPTSTSVQTEEIPCQSQTSGSLGHDHEEDARAASLFVW